MPVDWIIGIGIAFLVLGLALAIRFATRPKEVEMIQTNYVEAPKADSRVMAAEAPNAPIGDFRMMIEDVFMIKGRGVVVTGRVESGSVLVGQRVRLSSADGLDTVDTTLRGIESFKKQQAIAKTGDYVGLLLEDLSKEQVKKGMVVIEINE